MSFTLLQADALHLPLADKSVDLVLGSPPYCDARTYGIGAKVAGSIPAGNIAETECLIPPPPGGSAVRETRQRV